MVVHSNSQRQNYHHHAEKYYRLVYSPKHHQCTLYSEGCLLALVNLQLDPGHSVGWVQRQIDLYRATQQDY